MNVTDEKIDSVQEPNTAAIIPCITVLGLADTATLWAPTAVVCSSCGITRERKCADHVLDPELFGAISPGLLKKSKNINALRYPHTLWISSTCHKDHLKPFAACGAALLAAIFQHKYKANILLVEVPIPFI